MAPDSLAARAAADGLLARAAEWTGPHGDRPRPPDRVAAAEQVCRDLTDALSRTFGPYGVHALLTRALFHARGDHPVLAAVRLRGPGEPGLDGLADAARSYGPAVATAGVAAMVAALIDLLGRVIGEDLAVSLVSHAMQWPAADVADVGRDARTLGAGDQPNGADAEGES